VSRAKIWLVALGVALLIAAGAMALLKTRSDPEPGEAGGRGNVVGTSGAILVVMIVAGASARRRRRREKEGRKDG
jgi:hypothetical protein